MTADQPYQVMPPLADDEYEALKASIVEHGVLVPVEYDHDGNILDGHHRVRACRELGIEEWPTVTRRLVDEDDRRRHARVVNLARRHLNREQKRQLIADEVQSDADRSDRAIGRLLGVDHKTVGSVRRELRGEVPHLPPKVVEEDLEDLNGRIVSGLIRADAHILCALLAGAAPGHTVQALTKGIRDGWRDMPSDDFGVLWDTIVQPRIDGVYAFPDDGHYRMFGLEVCTWEEWGDEFDPDIADRARQALAAMGIAAGDAA